jgi:hypothetical protein
MLPAEELWEKGGTTLWKDEDDADEQAKSRTQTKGISGVENKNLWECEKKREEIRKRLGNRERNSSEIRKLKPKFERENSQERRQGGTSQCCEEERKGKGEDAKVGLFVIGRVDTAWPETADSRKTGFAAAGPCRKRHGLQGAYFGLSGQPQEGRVSLISIIAILVKARYLSRGIADLRMLQVVLGGTTVKPGEWISGGQSPNYWFISVWYALFCLAFNRYSTQNITTTATHALSVCCAPVAITSDTVHTF